MWTVDPTSFESWLAAHAGPVRELAVWSDHLDEADQSVAAAVVRFAAALLGPEAPLLAPRDCALFSVVSDEDGYLIALMEARGSAIKVAYGPFPVTEVAAQGMSTPIRDVVEDLLEIAQRLEPAAQALETAT